MNIVIKDFQNKNLCLQVKSDDKCKMLYDYIEDKLKIPIKAQRLIFAGKQLYFNDSIEKYNIREGSIIHLVGRFGWNA